MRYYPCSEINIKNVKTLLGNMVFKEYTEQWLLTNSGIFKYIGDDLTVLKFNLNEDDIILKKFLDNDDFIATPNTWKKIGNINHIPMINKKITVKVCTFSPSIKSKFKFVTESYDSGKVDYYFISPEEPTNKSLQEDISSFFEALT